MFTILPQTEPSVNKAGKEKIINEVTAFLRFSLYEAGIFLVVVLKLWKDFIIYFIT